MRAGRPPRLLLTPSVSPCRVRTAPQVEREREKKKDVLDQRGEGAGNGAGAVRFCSAKKGGLFLADQPAILTRGIV